MGGWQETGVNFDENDDENVLFLEYGVCSMAVCIYENLRTQWREFIVCKSYQNDISLTKYIKLRTRKKAGPGIYARGIKTSLFLLITGHIGM